MCNHYRDICPVYMTMYQFSNEMVMQSICMEIITLTNHYFMPFLKEEIEI